MPNKKKEDIEKQHVPVQVEWELCVKGGLLTAPKMVQSRTVKHSKRDIQFISISHQDAWLCEIVTGKPVSRRPLSKSTLISDLRRAVDASAGVDSGVSVEKKDKMNELDFPDSEPERDPTPKKRRTHRPSKTGDPEVVDILGPPSASSPGECRKLRALLSGSSLWLEVDALPWLVHRIREELGSTAIGAAPDDASPTPSASGIYWDFRDDRWMGNATTKCGVKEVRTGPVRRRMAKGKDLESLSFADAKDRVFTEMLQWLQEVTGEEQPALSR